MSIHICKCKHKGMTEFHLRYPGMSEEAAQDTADRINAGGLRPKEEIQALQEFVLGAPYNLPLKECLRVLCVASWMPRDARRILLTVADRLSLAEKDVATVTHHRNVLAQVVKDMMNHVPAKDHKEWWSEYLNKEVPVMMQTSQDLTKLTNEELASRIGLMQAVLFTRAEGVMPLPVRDTTNLNTDEKETR